MVIKFSNNVITLSHTIRTFNDPTEKVFENIVGKGENPGNMHFLLSPQDCYTSRDKSHHQAKSNFTSANLFDLDKSGNLASGKE